MIAPKSSESFYSVQRPEKQVNNLFLDETEKVKSMIDEYIKNLDKVSNLKELSSPEAVLVEIKANKKCIELLTQLKKQI
jgi:hypothetical protein|nr:MAG TPA: hypothetical protein [Caudoviricetes sp.]